MFQMKSYALVLNGQGQIDENELESDLATHGTMRHAPRLRDLLNTNAVEGTVHYAPLKSLWWSGMACGALIGAPLFFSWGGVLLFLVTTALTICLGHSVGMHRRLIHRSFECPLWLEYGLIYLGVSVGLAGPLGIIVQHDIRDWAQRREACHAFLAHKSGFWRDGFWQLHCALHLKHPPLMLIEQRVREDRFYQFIEKTFYAQQLLLALVFYAFGGWSFVFWGICLRVFASLTGHWLIGYFAHNKGERIYFVKGSGVQGYNIPAAGLVSMGESYHNNHHAFPASARLGLQRGETDLGWLFIKVLKRLGLVWGVNEPHNLPTREAVVLLKSYE